MLLDGCRWDTPCFYVSMSLYIESGKHPYKGVS